VADQIRVYSTIWCSDCRRAKNFLRDRSIPYENIDIEHDEEGRSFVEKVTGGMHSVPTILFPDGSILVEPSNAQLAKKLGIYK